MGDNDWDSVTRIGSKVRGTGGGAAHATRVKGNSALNAAQRRGEIIGTEKKFTSANASGRSVEGQHLTKVDRDDNPKAPKVVSHEVKLAVEKGRNALSMSQKELAHKCNTTEETIKRIESEKAQPDQQLLGKMERVLKVKLRGKGIGTPLPEPAKKK